MGDRHAGVGESGSPPPGRNEARGGSLRRGLRHSTDRGDPGQADTPPPIPGCRSPIPYPVRRTCTGLFNRIITRLPEEITASTFAVPIATAVPAAAPIAAPAIVDLVFRPIT
jgi:hypothetical protein